ncbi:MAG: Mut7-C ubiquitin/RNAse domain-containing protein [Roseiflexus sp.]|nr:Mut7-C ubiquitin/RNAse domain-containing protein [Roseiflexus sp.]MCS7290762.1 Mut7-C ubiquitin/RNAse domain-containing protein [Roseiflexus sp.]MDW8146218.1 Mut7-C RNAse domain-containing protein [Roseiflexaceae bacterium]MDW8231391.1 Mut7-C RNAse domain-containing protein [Roseiflexaceae bacterium]
MTAPPAGQALIRVYGDLNDFLPLRMRETWFARPCRGCETVKNLIETCGVPHPEIGALFINGRPVDFDELVQPGDAIEAFPIAAAPEPHIPLRPPLIDTRFVLDTHLGRLAAYLRMLGYDCLYRNDAHDAELARLAHDEQRILLTRDLGLLKRSTVIYGAFVREVIPTRQIVEVMRRFNLAPAPTVFQRCMRCNSLTAPVSKVEIDHLLEPKTRQYFDTFRRCPVCGKIYWQGSHYNRMQALLERAVREGERREVTGGKVEH